MRASDLADKHVGQEVGVGPQRDARGVLPCLLPEAVEQVVHRLPTVYETRSFLLDLTPKTPGACSCRVHTARYEIGFALAKKQAPLQLLTS